jgi:hypothetical protein
VVKGTNTNDTVRENVPAEVVGCRGTIVVVNRTDPGRFFGEGLWAFTSDLRPMDEAASDEHDASVAAYRAAEGKMY